MKHQRGVEIRRAANNEIASVKELMLVFADRVRIEKKEGEARANTVKGSFLQRARSEIGLRQYRLRLCEKSTMYWELDKLT